MIDNLVYIQGSSSVLIPKSVTENGTYYASSDEADGYSSVAVNIPMRDLSKVYLSQSEYNQLSTADKLDPTKLYIIGELAYNWHYNEDKTLVVRENISDGSFQWYINNFQGDASSRYGGYIDVPSNLAKFIKFPQAPPITIGRESIPALLLIVTNTRTGGNTNSFYFEHSTNAGNFYKRIRWTRGTDIHKAIAYDTEFLQTNYEISGSGAARNAHVYATGNDWEEPTFDPYELSGDYYYKDVLYQEAPDLNSKSVTTNGTYYANDDNLDGYSSVTVSVQPNVDTKSITTNGTYNASSDNLDGYSSVTVSVPGMVDITQTDYDALPDAQKKNGSIYRILKNYEYHVSNDGDIVVKIGSGKTLWYFIGKYVNQEVSIPSELQSYKPTVSQLVQASKSYTDGGITQNGWVGFYNNYIRFWSTDWASLQAGYTYGVVDPNNDTNLQTLVYESPYNYRTYYVFYYMGEEYFTEPENIQPNYNWYMNDDQTLAVRVKVSDGSYRWYFNDYVEAGTPLPETDTNHWIPPILSKFFIQQSSMPITVTDLRGRNWTCNTVKLMSNCTIQLPSGSPVNGKATLIVGTTFHAQARGYNEPGGNLEWGTIRAIIESSDMTNWNVTGSQTNGTAYNTVTHTWVAPTFDPING